MRLWDLSLDERRCFVATLMGFDPNAPNPWPMQSIDELLRAAERKALMEIELYIQKCTRA